MRFIILKNAIAAVKAIAFVGSRYCFMSSRSFSDQFKQLLVEGRYLYILGLAVIVSNGLIAMPS